MRPEIKEEARNYVKAIGEITLSAFKDKMRTDMRTAKDLLWELVNDGLVEHSVGFLFRYIGTDKIVPGKEEDDDQTRRKKYEFLFDSEESHENESSELKSLERRKEELEQRRKELLRRLKESLEDDEDDEDDDEEGSEDCEDNEEEWLFDDDEDDENDNDDEDEKTIDEIRKEVLKKMSATEEPSEDTEDEEETDDDDTTLRKSREITLEDIEKRRILAKIVTSFGCSGEFTRVGEEYYCTLGMVYPNDVPMTFKLSYKDKIILSDYGLTHKYISTYFDLADSNIQELIEKIMQEYNLTWITEGQMKELSIQIRDQGGAFISFLYFFSAIERISNISPEKWYKITSEKEDAFCKEETFKILFEQKATYEEAVKLTRDLYVKANEEKDEFKKNAYRKMTEMFQTIGAENFEYFKQRLLEEDDE